MTDLPALAARLALGRACCCGECVNRILTALTALVAEVRQEMAGAALKAREGEIETLQKQSAKRNRAVADLEAGRG